MNTKPAIIIPAISGFVEEARPLVTAMREAEQAEKRDEQRLNTSREVARARRLEVGMYLRTARTKFPARDDAKNGWTAFLEAIEMSRSSAHLLMEFAGNVSNRTASMTTEQAVRSGVRYDSPPPDDREVAPPSDADAPPEADRETADEVAADRARERGLRDGWCTPEPIAKALPKRLDLDPCSNPRSIIVSKTAYSLEVGQNGLDLPWFGLAFVNGPYSNLLPWAEKLAAEIARGEMKGAGFLVNADNSPEWWHVLTKHLNYRLDFDERLEFIPPEGVEPSKNDRPQTLLMDAAFWKACDQRALLAMGTLWIKQPKEQRE